MSVTTPGVRPASTYSCIALFMRASRSLERPTSSGADDGNAFELIPAEPAVTSRTASTMATVRVSPNIQISWQAHAWPSILPDLFAADDLCRHAQAASG